MTSDQPAHIEPRRRSWLIPPLLIAATMATYWPILFNGFVALDDRATIYGNPNLTHLSWDTYWNFWTAPQRDLYAPLTYTLYSLVALVAKIHPRGAGTLEIPFRAWPFHALSLLLHVGCVILVYRLLRRLLKRDWPAAAGAAVFALHPVQVESVAWATETNNLLCTLFGLAALLVLVKAAMIDIGQETSALRSANRKRAGIGLYALATELFIGALLSKPLAVIVPLLAFVLLLLVSAELRETCDRRIVVSKTDRPVPVIWIWLSLAVPFALVIHHSTAHFDFGPAVPIRHRPLVACDAIAFYLYKLAWPMALTPDYARSPTYVLTQVWHVYTAITGAAIVVGLIVMFLIRRRTTTMAWGGLWFLIALLPVLGLTPHPFQPMSTVADRYLYLPMVGVAMAVGAVLQALHGFAMRGAARTGCKLVPRLGVALTIGILCALGIRSARQCGYWRDTESLFSHSRQIIGRDPGLPDEGR